MAVRLSVSRAGRLLPQGRFLVLISVRGLVDSKAIVLLEGLGHLKNPVTLWIEPATFQLVTQCLKQLRYRVSLRKETYQILIPTTEEVFKRFFILNTEECGTPAWGVGETRFGGGGYCEKILPQNWIHYNSQNTNICKIMLNINRLYWL
jgi:hypothetical protein